MNEPMNDELGALSSEAVRFLQAQREVGTPTPAELRRVRSRVVPQNVVPVRRGARFPELWAVAAVVLVSVAAQLIYLAVRGEDVEAKLDAAWAGGSIEQVTATVERCGDDACRARGAKMLAALTLASQASPLSGEELSRLEALDAELSPKGPSPLTERVARERRTDAALTPAQRLERAMNLQQRGDLAGALAALETCVTRAPDAHACWRVLGDVSSAIATRENSAAAAARAREAYGAFLTVAPVDDPFVPRITAMLDREATGAHEIDGQNVKLRKGAKATLRLKAGLQRVAVGDPDILDITSVTGDTLQVLANNAGDTTVLVWFGDGTRQTLSIVVEE